MATVEENPWGSVESMWFGSILPRIAPFLPVEHLLEIACGDGRLTRFLVEHCTRLIGVDRARANIDGCTQRFAATPGVAFFRDDGRSLPMIRDASVDFAFSWATLVRCDATVLAAYVAELGRTLRPGGHAFLHHSNLGAFVDDDGRPVVETAPWRDPSVSAELVRALSSRHGLTVRSQELLGWGSEAPLDCITALWRPSAGPGPAAPADPDRVRVEESDIGSEARHAARLDALYRCGPHGPGARGAPGG